MLTIQKFLATERVTKEFGKFVYAKFQMFEPITNDDIVIRRRLVKASHGSLVTAFSNIAVVIEQLLFELRLNNTHFVTILSTMFYY